MPSQQPSRSLFGSSASSAQQDLNALRRAVDAAVSNGGGTVITWLRSSETATASRASHVVRCTVRGHVSGSLGTDLSIALERPVTVDVEPARDGVFTLSVAVANAPFTAPNIVRRLALLATGIGVVLGFLVCVAASAIVGGFPVVGGVSSNA